MLRIVFLTLPGDTQLDMHLNVFVFALSIPLSLRRNYYFLSLSLFFTSRRRLALDVPVIPPSIGLGPIFCQFFFLVINSMVL